MIINDLDDYYIVFDAKNRNTELDTLFNYRPPLSPPKAGRTGLSASWESSSKCLVEVLQDIVYQPFPQASKLLLPL